MYEIGSKTWFRGDEVTVESAPFVIGGRTFQNARTEAGKLVAIATPETKTANVAAAQATYAEMQAGFRRLRS